VSTPAPPVATPTAYPAREGEASFPAVEKPEVPIITSSSGLLHTGAPYAERKSGSLPPMSSRLSILRFPPLALPFSTQILGPLRLPRFPAPGLHPEAKPTDINLPSGSEAPKASITYIPSPTFPAEVQKPSTNTQTVEHPEIKSTRVIPEASAPTVTEVKKPEHGNEHGNGPSVDHPSVPDITNVGGVDHTGDNGDAPSVSHPSTPDVTETKDQGYKVPDVAQPTPSYTTTSVPGFHKVHHPFGTPDLGNIKGKTEGGPPSPNTSGVRTPKTDDMKGKGKESGEYEIEGDGEWGVEHTRGPWGAETEGDHEGVKVEVEHDGDD